MYAGVRLPPLHGSDGSSRLIRVLNKSFYGSVDGFEPGVEVSVFVALNQVCVAGSSHHPEMHDEPHWEFPNHSRPLIVIMLYVNVFRTIAVDVRRGVLPHSRPGPAQLVSEPAACQPVKRVEGLPAGQSKVAGDTVDGEPARPVVYQPFDGSFSDGCHYVCLDIDTGPRNLKLFLSAACSPGCLT